MGLQHIMPVFSSCILWKMSCYGQIHSPRMSKQTEVQFQRTQFYKITSIYTAWSCSLRKNCLLCTAFQPSCCNVHVNTGAPEASSKWLGVIKIIVQVVLWQQLFASAWHWQWLNGFYHKTNRSMCFAVFMGLQHIMPFRPPLTMLSSESGGLLLR